MKSMKIVGQTMSELLLHMSRFGRPFSNVRKEKGISNRPPNLGSQIACACGLDNANLCGFI
jgi:hypothetical protein